jgi:hypothetical protein
MAQDAAIVKPGPAGKNRSVRNQPAQNPPADTKTAPVSPSK